MSPLRYNSATVSAEREFYRLENPTLEDAMEIIKRWFSPEDIFDVEILETWADEHGLIKGTDLS